MSAFLVSKKHIDALVYARSLFAYRSGAPDARLSHDELGRLLWRENMASLVALYGARHGDKIDEEALAAYRYERPSKEIKVLALLRAIDCYEYQSCEHDGFAFSKAHEYCRSVARNLVPLLPGYDDAPWGID